MNNMNLNNIAGKRTTTDYKLIFHSPLIKSFSSRNNEEDDVLNKIVYHYTSPSAFLSIIQSQTLRFTDIRYLNDKSEGIYFVKLLLDFMDSYRNEYPLFNEVINQQSAITHIKMVVYLFSAHAMRRILLTCGIIM